MQLYINHRLKKAIISHPKTCGSTLAVYLTWDEPHWQLHPNISNWKVGKEPQKPKDLSLKYFHDHIPEDYEVFVLYRNPLLRYISGFSYVVLEQNDMFFWNLLDNKTRNEYFVGLGDQWYLDYVEILLKTAFGHASLNDVHTTRMMLAVWVLAQEFNAKLVYIDDLDQLINDMHGISPHIEIPHVNANQFGYSTHQVEGRVDVSKTIGRNFAKAITTIHNAAEQNRSIEGIQWATSIHEYLEIDFALFNPIHSKKYLRPGYTEKLTEHVVQMVLERAHSTPGGQDLLSNNAYWYQDYLCLLNEWANVGRNIPETIKHNIVNSIAEIQGNNTIT